MSTELTSVTVPTTDKTVEQTKTTEKKKDDTDDLKQAYQTVTESDTLYIIRCGR